MIGLSSGFATAKSWAYILSAKHEHWFRELRIRPTVANLLKQADDLSTYEVELPNGIKAQLRTL